MTVPNMIRKYVSPFDDRVRPAEPLAARPAAIAGRTIGLLDISKNRGAAFLDEIAGRADLVVEALAD